MSKIPLDAYGSDFGYECWVPTKLKRDAVTLAQGILGDDLQAERCHLRLLTPEECDAQGWEHPAVTSDVPPDHPDAVPGWHVWERE